MTAGVDVLFLIPFIVVSVVLGQPLSYTSCSELPKTSAANTFLALPVGNKGLSYVIFVGAQQTTCYEIMAVWGLLIVLCVLFTVSAIAAGFLFIGKRRAIKAAAANVGFYGDHSMGPESQVEMTGPPKAWSDAESFRGGPPGPPSEASGHGPTVFPGRRSFDD